MKSENWKNIEGYDFYQVSNTGNVRSLNKSVSGHNGLKVKKGKILNKNKKLNGYLFVRLSHENSSKQFNIHRLVATAFIPNPHSKETVNHINGIKTDNRVENLEWCTRSEQMTHAIKLKLFTPTTPTKGKFGKDHNRSIGVQKLSMTGELIKEFGSACEAARESGCFQTGISKCCRGELKTHKGFKWKFK